LATERVERKLAAILAADVAGYSRLMGANEEGTHERLKAHLRQVVDPKLKEYRGRTSKTPATASWWSFRPLWMRCVVPSRSSAR
jgi:class 3 adenylate cyclase